jgi:4-hydroxy-tetrahydrodipicolinate reductase
MGRALAELAPGADCEVVATLDRAATTKGVDRTALNGAEVAIEFTAPAEAARLVRACAAIGLPVVSGTTGWDDERPDVEAEVRRSTGALLWAPNFAIGVHLFAQLVARAAELFAPHAAYEAHLVETHHAAKRDAPSGTARMLAERAAQARGGARGIPITSVRVGHVPGTHELVIDAPFEQVRLVHEARDRRVFAAGALTAARWLAGKRGVFTLDDVLGGAAR